MWHFGNEENEFNLDQSKSKFTFNLRNKDAAIKIHMSSLEKKLMKIEIPKDKYNNLASKERQALYNYGRKNRKKNDRTKYEKSRFEKIRHWIFRI